MSGRGKASGNVLTISDAEIVLGMIARGDREHDIAAWFGVNQGRIAEVKDGKFGAKTPAAPEKLPPRGSPGIKGKRLRASIKKAIEALSGLDGATTKEALNVLVAAAAKYDANES